MEIYDSVYSFKFNKTTTLTLGTFDGVHLGHQSILDKIKKATLDKKSESVVLTFFPHPRMVLQQDSSIKLLNTMDEKAILLEKFGIDNLIIHPFDEVFSSLSAEAFVKEILVDTLNIRKIIIGYDHRFGKNRSANINDLISFGKKYNFEVEQIEPKEVNEIAISSTKIRKSLLEGNVKLANQYLGYAYFISGEVIEGRKIGRTIGFPTANIQISEDYKLLPKKGVYVVATKIKSTLFFGMMNIGTNPTVGINEQSIEVHFFNFNSDIYKERLEISVLGYVRSEQKFDSLELLKQQLEKDREFSLLFLQNNETTFI